MQSILDPAILFFVFGILAGALKSNLEIPPQISRFLGLYLLMALGLKGGFALAKSGLTHEVTLSLAGAIALAIVIPAIGYRLLRRFLNGFDAAAIAADTAACEASWTKMDSKKAGFIMSADMKDEMAMMTKAGRTTAASDRMTDKEFMAACLADVFTPDKK